METLIHTAMLKLGFAGLAGLWAVKAAVGYFLLRLWKTRKTGTKG